MNFSIKPQLITPAYAAELLKMNTNNRAIRQSKVDALAESMRKGEWELSNDAITISEGNALLNGQHRLMAVVKSGVPCNFIVYTGAPDSTFDIMDTPSLRKVSDVIQRKGGTNTVRMQATIAAVSRWIDDYENNWETLFRFDNHARGTRREAITYYEEHKDILTKWLNRAAQIVEKNVALLPTTTLAGFAVFLESKLNHSEEKIATFLKELILDGMTSNGTILYARKRLLRNKMKLETLKRGDDIRLLVRAWNDFCLGRQVQIIKMNEDVFVYIRPV